MKRMSFALTLDQLLNGSKTVTRRYGWRNLKVGERIVAVDRVMGLRRGEKARVLGTIVVRDLRREPLDAITLEDVAREGFPQMTVVEFVAMFCREMKTDPWSEVTRIEFDFERAEGRT